MRIIGNRVLELVRKTLRDVRGIDPDDSENVDTGSLRNRTNASMATVHFQGIADEQVLYLSTVGRTTGLRREIEIWFVVCGERFYLFAETGEAAGWVKNVRRNPKVTLRIRERQIDATARVLDRQADAERWDQATAIANRKRMGRRAAGRNHAASFIPHPIIPGPASSFAPVAEQVSIRWAGRLRGSVNPNQRTIVRTVRGTTLEALS